MTCPKKPLKQWLAEDDEALQRNLIDPAVKYLLDKKKGLLFSEQDAVDVAVDALYEASDKFDAARGKFESLFWTKVRSRAIDRIRRNRRRQTQFDLHRDALLIYRRDLASRQLTSFEQDEEDRRARAALREAMTQLTPRMTTAIEARFNHWDNSRWAEDLVNTEGHTPKYWRKASDDGIRRLATILSAAGFKIRTKGATIDAVPSRS